MTVNSGQHQRAANPEQADAAQSGSGTRRVLAPTANRRQALDLEEDFLEPASFHDDPNGAIERSPGPR